MAVDVFCLPPRRRCGFHFLVSLTDRITKLIQVDSVHWNCSVHAEQAFVCLSVFKYCSLYILLYNTRKQYILTLFQFVFHLLCKANVFTAKYYCKQAARASATNDCYWLCYDATWMIIPRTATQILWRLRMNKTDRCSNPLTRGYQAFVCVLENRLSIP